jgi:membrane protein YqaA with SNARE-associated domain
VNPALHSIHARTALSGTQLAGLVGLVLLGLLSPELLPGVSDVSCVLFTKLADACKAYSAVTIQSASLYDGTGVSPS